MRKRVLIACGVAAATAALAAPLTAAAVFQATSVPAACVVVNGPGGATIQAGYAPTGPGGCTQI
jgi:hypothetical protein